MKLIAKRFLFILLVSFSLVFVVSCGPVPYCSTDLVTLDETRLDAVTYEEEAAKTGKEVSKLEKDVKEVQLKISNIEGKPAELEKRIHELRKGSGLE
ncbi:hypothetical protein J7M07_07465 [bacterium]|nr:hypothetical protein [bacterium]